MTRKTFQNFASLIGSQYYDRPEERLEVAGLVGLVCLQNNDRFDQDLFLKAVEDAAQEEDQIQSSILQGQ